MGVYTSANLIYGLDLNRDTYADNVEESTEFLRNFLLSKGYVPRYGQTPLDDPGWRESEEDIWEILIEYIEYGLNLQVEYYGEGEFYSHVVGVGAKYLGDHWRPIPVGKVKVSDVDPEDAKKLRSLQEELKILEGPEWYVCISRG